MRRMINNTTAIAACLSLLVPQFAQAQGAPAEGEQPPVPPAQEQPAEPQAEAAAPAAEAQAEPAEAEPEPAAEAPEAQAETQPAAEPEPAGEAPAEPAAQETAPEPAPEPQPAEAAEPASAPEAQPQDAEVQEAEGQPEADAAAERPEPAAREQQQDRPEDRPADQATQAEPPAAEPPAEAEAAREQDQEPPAEAEAAREQDEERPAAAEAAREQDQERPAPAAREQQAERPEAAPAEAAEGSDPLRDALEAEQQAEDQPAAATADEPAQAEAGTDAPAAQAEADADAPAAPDEDELRDALTREQAETPVTEEQPQEADQTAEAPETAPEADSPATEGAQQAAQETSAAPAAALNEDQQGEVVEQQITEENSRSSDEDFATSLRDALAPQAQSEAAPEEDDDDNNDLAKALLLGLGAVAVGTYLNNNRQVALSAPDRVVVTRADGSQEVIKDEVALLRQPGSTVATENFDDGSSRTVVTRADGSRVVTIRDADLRVLRRTLVSPDGTQTRLIDDTAEVEPVDVATLPAPAPVAATGASQDEAALRAALQREVDIDRRFTLGQIRSIPQVRALVPPVTIDAITFDTGSAAISPDQARQLSTLGGVIQEAIAENPREMFLIEGHTDTVGADAANLALSDRRAESVALALSEYFQVPPENLVVQGYGEQFPQVAREGDVRENRRAAVRRITDLLQTAQAQ